MVLHENVKEFPDQRMTDNLGLVRVGVCLYVDGNYSHQHTPGCSDKGMTFGNLNVYWFDNIMDLTPLSLRGTEFKLLLKALLDPTESASQCPELENICCTAGSPRISRSFGPLFESFLLWLLGCIF